jgi:ligand-binding sensor domain-containing protein
MYSLDPSTGKKTPSGLEDARNLTIDNQGQVWATTTEWLNTNIMILEDGKWEKTAQRKGEINALVISDQGRVWVRYKSGVSVLGSAGDWTDYPYDPTMYDGVYPILNSRNFDVDMRGRVWTGTQWGLYMLDPNSGWVKYNVTDNGLVRSDTELTENQVHDLIIDNAQRLWISLEKTDGRGNPSGNMVGILDLTVTP